jgi:hypothetical protein
VDCAFADFAWVACSFGCVGFLHGFFGPVSVCLRFLLVEKLGYVVVFAVVFFLSSFAFSFKALYHFWGYVDGHCLNLQSVSQAVSFMQVFGLQKSFRLSKHL